MKRALVISGLALVAFACALLLPLGRASATVVEPIDATVISNMDSCQSGPVVLAPIEPAFGPREVAHLGGWALLVVGLTLLPLVRRKGRQSGSAMLCTLLLLAGGAGLITAHNLTTAKGNPITHTHPPETVTPGQVAFQEASDAQLIPGQRTVEGPPSSTYDCHGKTFDGTGSWINNDQVDKILRENGYSKAKGGARLGDIVVYRTPDGAVTHSGVVTGIDSNGNVTEVCSKWGSGFEYRHKPDEVPQGQTGTVNGVPVTRGTYGKPTVYHKN